MSLYATLTEGKYALRESSPTTADATNDPQMLDYLEMASRAIDDVCGWMVRGEIYTDVFAPRIDTIYLDSLGDHIDDTMSTIDLPLPVCAVTELKVGVDATGAEGTALVLDTDFAYYPKGRASTLHLRRIDGAGWSTGATASGYVESIKVTGTWSFRRQYATKGWGIVTALPASSGAIGTSVVTFNVASGGGALLGKGMIIGIPNASGVLEIMNITGVSTDSVTVAMRADNGSTAAAHADSAIVYVWNVETVVAWACARTAAFSLKQVGQFQSSTFDGVMSVKYPQIAFPPDVLEPLSHYADRRAVITGGNLGY